MCGSVYFFRMNNNDLLINLIHSHLSLESVLLCVSQSGRLPMSMSTLAAVSGIEESDLHEKLRNDSRISLETVGGTAMITAVRIPARQYPTAEIRDDVLTIFSYSQHREKREAPRTCRFVTKEYCTKDICHDVHFDPINRVGLTENTAGFCSYLNHCKNPKCKFLHFKSELAVPTTIRPEGSQWINCDVRFLQMHVFHSLVSAVLIDPPWDIHMELSYGTMTDDEMRNLPVSYIHSQECGGYVFIWATTRTVEVARDCLRIWGYIRVDEIVWIKTNQIGGTVRSGRTGHWLNHNKEHCLIGMKGNVAYTRVGMHRLDCDVIVAPVRENSRKPDEIYGIIERIVGKDTLCLELFGRAHNRRPGWITVGNQLENSFLTDLELVRRLGFS